MTKAKGGAKAQKAKVAKETTKPSIEDLELVDKDVVAEQDRELTPQEQIDRKKAQAEKAAKKKAQKRASMIDISIEIPAGTRVKLKSTEFTKATVGYVPEIHGKVGSVFVVKSSSEEAGFSMNGKGYLFNNKDLEVIS